MPNNHLAWLLVIICTAEQIVMNGLFNLSNTCQAWSWSQELESSPLATLTCPLMSIKNRFLCVTRGQSVCICSLLQMYRDNESLSIGIWVPRFLTGSLKRREKSKTNTKHPNWLPISIYSNYGSSSKLSQYNSITRCVFPVSWRQWLGTFCRVTCPFKLKS